MFALPRVAGEVVRLCSVASRAGAVVTISLTDAPGAVARARGVALYRVGIAYSWRDDLGVLTLADANGERIEWPLPKVAEWLTITLGGWPVVVALEFNAGRLSQSFEGLRGERQAGYMAALDVQAMHNDAAQRRAAVAGLPFDSVRRVTAEDRAAVIDGSAALVELLQAEALAVWGGP